MKLVTILFLLISAKICNCIFCNDGSNPCQLDNPQLSYAYFLPRNGYHCLDAFNGQIICTCPDNSTRHDRPCRICDRDPNPCGTGPSVVACTDINQSFSCLCNDRHGGFVVLTTPCEGGTATITPPPGDPCDKDGVRDPTTNLCHCPSGFSGNNCEIRTDAQLCDKIECMSRGVCAVRPIVSGETLYQAKCLCRAGFDGEYCEKQGTLTSCTPTHCLNNGVCQQRDVGIARYAFCHCKAGWVGSRCEKEYFRCKSEGYFVDEYMKNQGKYLWCIPYNNDYLIKQKSCPKGLKFNVEKQLCL